MSPSTVLQRFLDVIAEGERKQLVFRMAQLRKRDRSGDHLAEFRPHAAAVVDEQSN